MIFILILFLIIGINESAKPSFKTLSGCINIKNYKNDEKCLRVSLTRDKKITVKEALEYDKEIPEIEILKYDETKKVFNEIKKIAWYRNIESFVVYKNSNSLQIFNVKSDKFEENIKNDDKVDILFIGKFLAKYTCPDLFHVYYHDKYPACFYVEFSKSKTYKFGECREKCRNFASAELASFDSEEQYDEFFKMMPSKSDIKSQKVCDTAYSDHCYGFWIGTRLPNGASDRAHYVPFNIDGSPVRYTAWGKGEPNGYGKNPVTGFDERCVELYGYELPDGRHGKKGWNDYDCSVGVIGCICRKSVDRT